MKKLLLVAVAAFLASTTTFAQEKSPKEIYKERKEILKYSAKQLDVKASKDARKEAKRLSKEGWKAMPGALPLEKQLDRSYKMQNEFTDDLYPKFILGSASSTGSNYDAAKIEASNLAIQDLASRIQQETTSLIESNVSNAQLGEGEATSVTKTVMANKALISQSIGRTLTVVEAYRDLPGGQKEVMVRLAYSGDLAKKQVRDMLTKELVKEGKELSKELDNMLWGK